MKNKNLTIRKRYMTKRRIATARKRLILFTSVLFSVIIISGYGYQTSQALAEQPVIEPVIIVKEKTVQEKIIDYADTYGVERETALRIANCESGYNPLAKNKTSSATGVYQFINSTWDNYCKGDRLNADDNIICFMELYPKHPQWWMCK